MHDKIRRFELTGIISDDKLMQTFERLVDDVEGSMRDEGFVPVLDLHPQFTRVFDHTTDTYDFTLSVYGVYVGENAWQILGVMSGREIQKSTPQDRLSLS